MDRWRRRFWILLAILVGVPLVIGIALAIRFLPNRPVTYADIEEHFKYGSTGGYAASGFPYWIWKAMPVVFKDRLPQNGGKGYEAFGMIFEPGARPPHRRAEGAEHGHRSGVRELRRLPSQHRPRHAAQSPRVYLGMPAARFDLGVFEQFLFDIAADERFDTDNIIPEIETPGRPSQSARSLSSSIRSPSR